MQRAWQGDRITVLTLDRLGRTVRDTLNLIHELDDRKIGLRNLADPIKVDTTDPEDSMGHLAVAAGRCVLEVVSQVRVITAVR